MITPQRMKKLLMEKKKRMAGRKMRPRARLLHQGMSARHRSQVRRKRPPEGVDESDKFAVT